MSELAGTGAGPASSETATPAPPGAPAPGSRRRGRRLAAILAAVTCVLALAIAATAVEVLAHRPHHAAASHPLRGTVFQLRLGQCVNSPNGTAVARAVRCARPHDAEIYSTFRETGRHWPGAAVLSRQAQLDCQSKLSGSLTQQLALINAAEFYVYPNRGAWAAGGRSVICEIRGIRGKLTGSVPVSGS
jgi:Septum formation